MDKDIGTNAPPALGDLVKDNITGLEGIAIATTEWLHGCVRITIQPREVKEGKTADPITVDEPQVVVLQRSVVPNNPHWRFGERRREEETVPVDTRSRRTAGPRPGPTPLPGPTR